MNENRSRKRSIDSDIECIDLSTDNPKRRRSRSLSWTTSHPPLDSSPFSFSQPPPSAYDIDRLNYHINLESFSSELQKAANAIFPSDPSNLSRYSKVDVILLSWEEEDPNLPVSIEVKELSEIFQELYGFDVQEWLIPGKDCHNRLQTRILRFLDDSDPRHLKIVYYAGHGKLTNHGQPAWTSRRNSRKDRCPTVKWSGIQNTLEESQSDVLILLDCCSSGVCTTDEGNGVTELIAACAYNAIANGVGPFSFTHALNIKLRQMAQLPSFTIGHLYNAIFTEIQGWRFEDSKHRKVPVHLVLSQSRDRSVRLSRFSIANGKQRSTLNERLLPPSTGDSSCTEPLEVGSTPETPELASLPADSQIPFSQRPWPSSSGTSLSDLPEYPRLLLSIRLSEDVKPNELSSELFADWLRSFPASANFIKVEAGFASDSTLLILSMPPAMLGFLPADPAITILGTVRSENMMAQPQRSFVETVESVSFPSIRCRLNAKFSRSILLNAKLNTASRNSVIDYSLVKELGLLDLILQDPVNHDYIRIPAYLPDATITRCSSGSNGSTTALPSISVSFEIAYLNQPADPDAEESIRVVLGWETFSEYGMNVLFSQNLLTLHSDNQDMLSLPFVLPVSKRFDPSRTTFSSMMEASTTAGDVATPTFYPQVHAISFGDGTSIPAYSNDQIDGAIEIDDAVIGFELDSGVHPYTFGGNQHVSQPTAHNTRPKKAHQPASAVLNPAAPNEFLPNEQPDPEDALLSPIHSSAPSTPGRHSDDDRDSVYSSRSVYSLPVDAGNQVVLAKMKAAHLSLNEAVFGGDLPEDIGYEIYKLGTLVQALNPKRFEIDSAW